MNTFRRIAAICLLAALILPLLAETSQLSGTLAQDGQQTDVQAQPQDDPPADTEQPPDQPLPPDQDADGTEDAADNCVDIANPDQLDSDLDGIGDACDATPFGDPTDIPTEAPIEQPTDTPAATEGPSEEAVSDETPNEAETDTAVEAAASGVSIAFQAPNGNFIPMPETLYTGGGVSGACGYFTRRDPPVTSTAVRCDIEDGQLDGVIDGFSLTTGDVYFASFNMTGCWQVNESNAAYQELSTWGLTAASGATYLVPVFKDTGPGCDATDTPVPTNTKTPTATPSNTATQTPSSTATSTNTPTATTTTVPGAIPVGASVKTTASVSLRSGAGTGFSRIATVPSGKTGTVTGAPIVAGGYTWYPVTFAGYGSGYMASNYFSQTATGTTSTPTKTPTKTPTTVPGGFAVGATVQTTASVNLRATASSSGTVRAVIAKGTTGTITGAGVKSGNYTWYPISIGGQSGYIAGSYLKLATSVPPTNTATPTKIATAIPNVIPVGTLMQTTTNLNIRSCASTSCSILVMIGKGGGVRIKDAPVKVGSTLWYPVTYVSSGSWGWAAATYLKVWPDTTPTVEPTLTETKTSTPTATRTSTPVTPTSTPTATQTASPDAGLPGPHYSFASPFQCSHAQNIRSAPGFSQPTIATSALSHMYSITGDGVSADGYVWFPVSPSDGQPSGWVPYTMGCHAPPPGA